MKKYALVCALMVLFFSLPFQTYSQLVSPEVHFGFQPGSDRNLFNYEELIAYLDKLDKNSSRLKLIEIGKSPMGKPMYIAFISGEENISKLEALKTINRKLALEPNLSISEKENLLQNGRVFVLTTLSMHSSEVGPTQASAVIAYDLATTDDPQKLGWLKNVVLMMVPSHNPDGMDMVVDHYRKYKGTKYEGSDLPGIYHKYVGHDNNRDFVTLTQEDTRAISAIYSLDWFPQVLVEKHQMGSEGPRYFVPPNHDPIAENVDAGIWNWMGIFGANMIKDMTHDGLAGISQHYLFDDYWPGSTETCLWMNVIGMLTEGASSKVATPIYIEPTELKVTGKGLSEYKKSINMPLPWEGGWWRLSDLIRYEVSSTLSILKTASANKNDILRFRNDMCMKEVEKGRNLPPFYYIFPEKQHDQSELVNLVNLMKLHGIKTYKLSRRISINNISYDENSIVIPLAQPFRAFIKETLEKQNYPVRHYTPEGEIIKPYDITSWSLPLHFGVKAYELMVRSEDLENALIEITGPYNLAAGQKKSSGVILPVENNESFRTAFKALAAGIDVERLIRDEKIEGKIVRMGSFLLHLNKNTADLLNPLLANLTVSPVYLTSVEDIKSEKITLPRIGLVETYFHDMDAGWTRFVLDQYGIPFRVLRPGDLAKTNLSQDFDAILFPDMSRSVLMEGRYGSEDNYYSTDYPPEYTKGMGKTGMNNLMSFIDQGGLVISWGESVSLFEKDLTMNHPADTEKFRLPFSDISEDLMKKGLYCPGSLVKMKITKDHPVTLGMEEEIGIFFRGQPVFSTSIPDLDMDRRVLGVIPEKDILVSGYVEKEQLLGNKPVMIWMRKGKGQFILFGFDPQFRASTHVSYKLLFNSMLLKQFGK
jgi:hypothetical protein